VQKITTILIPVILVFVFARKLTGRGYLQNVDLEFFSTANLIDISDEYYVKNSSFSDPFAELRRHSK
jgi:hypothetical protein